MPCHADTRDVYCWLLSYATAALQLLFAMPRSADVDADAAMFSRRRAASAAATLVSPCFSLLLFSLFRHASHAAAMLCC